jgi:hypothetical protein
VKAREQFALGHYAEALEIYGKLYAETTHPTYLRNIGRCYQNLGEPDKAISSFREYLRQAKDLPADQRAQVEGYIREMEELKQKREAATTPPPPPAPRTEATTPSPAAPPPVPALTAPPGAAPPLVEQSAPASPHHDRRVAGIVVGSVAGAALITGGAFGLRAFSKRSASDGQCPAPNGVEHCSQTGVDLNNQAKTAALVSDIAFGAGLIGAAVATYLLVVPASGDASPPASGLPAGSPPASHALRLSPEVGPGLAGLAVAGSW